MSNHSVFTFSKIYRAFQACLVGKNKTANALRFVFNLEKNLAALLRDLQTRRYAPGQSICFAVNEPVIREIFAADFRDRIVHHLLVREVEPVFERRFIFNSLACRRGKGTVVGKERLAKGMRAVSSNFTREAFFLKLDLSGFFMSIDRRILFEIFTRTLLRVETHCNASLRNASLPEIFFLAEKIIFHAPTENYRPKGNLALLKKVPRRKSLFFAPPQVGLPIGNLTSQFFANVYLNELDQFVQRTLKCRYYYRYVDDFVLLATEKATLLNWKKEIEKFLAEKLRLTLHPQKQMLQSVYRGIDFIGYFIKPRGTLIRRRTVKNFKKKLFQWNEELEKQPPTLEKLKKILCSLNSYYGLLRQANTFQLRHHLYEKHFGALQKYFFPVNWKYEYFLIRGRRRFAPPADGRSS